MSPRIGSLFSGVGGLDLAVENTLGARTVWHVDNDPAATRVLAHHWPDVANHGDITRVGLPYSDDEWAAMQHRAETDPAYELPAPDWSVIEPIDVLVGGWPCQDLSAAGKRAGIQGARSGLYRHLINAVRVLRPRFVVLENVAAVLVRGFDVVAADISACGYDLSWLCLRASDIGAPHHRDRFFAVAHPQGHGRHKGRPEPSGLVGGSDAALSGATVPNPDGAARGQRGQPASGQTQTGWTRAHIGGRGRTPAADAESIGQQTRCVGGRDTTQRPELDRDHISAWGDYGPAIRRWEHILGRPAPAPTVPGTRGGHVLSPRFVEFLMGLPDGWVTGVPGLSRNAQLRLLGNGCVPQQAIAALQLLLAHDTRMETAA